MHAARWRDVELRVADLALGHRMAIVREIAPDQRCLPRTASERDTRVPLGVGRCRERVPPVEEALALVAHRNERAGPLRRGERELQVEQIARRQLEVLAANVPELA